MPIFGRQRIAVGVAIGDEEGVRPELDPEVEAVGDQVPEAPRHPALRQNREPGQERGCADDADRVVIAVRARAAGHAESPAEQQRGDDEHESKSGLPAVLGLGGRDLRVDWVAARRALEAWIGVGAEVQIGEDVSGVSQVARLHVMCDRLAREQDREPVDEREREGQQAEYPQDEQVRDDENEPEEDRRAGSLEVVADDDPGPLPRWAHLSGRRRRGRLPGGRRSGLFAGHARATYPARPTPFCHAASAVTTSNAATTRQGNASPATVAVAPPPTLPSTWPAAQAMLIRPAARPWCRELTPAASLNMAIAGAKHSPAPTDMTMSSARTTPST